MKFKLIIFLLCRFLLVNAQSISSAEYINQFKDLAIQEMQRTGIPASITIAQGMLESGNGNSRLAIKGNNHFGIKCHGSWDGGKIYHDDDAEKECFRKYKSVYESYIDHSDFLTNTPRYASLFELKPTDYKGWAKGLKKAGYATAPDYDKKLIQIIERYELHGYDVDFITQTLSNNEESFILETGRTVKTNNNINYIVARENDTYNSLTNEMELLKWQLAKYNEIDQGADINKGDIIYLQPKRNKAAVGNKKHIVKQGETMHSISQVYGIKLDKLYRKNHIGKGDQPEVGEVLWLRKNKKSTKPPINKTKDNQKKNNKEKKQKELPDNNQNEMEFTFD